MPLQAPGSAKRMDLHIGEILGLIRRCRGLQCEETLAIHAGMLNKCELENWCMPCHRHHMQVGGVFPVAVLASGAAGKHALDSLQGGIQSCNPGFRHSFLFECSSNLTALPSLP